MTEPDEVFTLRELMQLSDRYTEGDIVYVRELESSYMLIEGLWIGYLEEEF